MFVRGVGLVVGLAVGLVVGLAVGLRVGLVVGRSWVKLARLGVSA